jgi:hypothetical protein
LCGQDVDFTDMLWSVLCGAGSYEELKEALNLVLLTIVRHDVRPFIHYGSTITKVLVFWSP